MSACLLLLHPRAVVTDLTHIELSGVLLLFLTGSPWGASLQAGEMVSPGTQLLCGGHLQGGWGGGRHPGLRG